eukprot:gene2846-561_t
MPPSNLSNPTMFPHPGVRFPFPPYKCQEKVVEGIRDRSNVIIESPTGRSAPPRWEVLGTARTSLAWQSGQDSDGSGTPRIPAQQPHSARLPSALQPAPLRPEARSSSRNSSARLQGPLPCTTQPSHPEASGGPRPVPAQSSSDSFLMVPAGPSAGLPPTPGTTTPQPSVAAPPAVEPSASSGLPPRPRPRRFVSMLPRGGDGKQSSTSHAGGLRGQGSKVFYLSRTHAQVKQLVGELARTSYRPLMDVLAGRSKYCVNAKVRGISNDFNNLGEMCDKMVSLHQCRIHTDTDHLTQKLATLHTNKYVEDLVKLGLTRQGCPYYAARDFVAHADLIFCPYQYLLDPVIRHETKIEHDLKDAVLVADEAHNLEQVCRDGTSYSVDCQTLQQVMQDDLSNWITEELAAKAFSESPLCEDTPQVFDLMYTILSDLCALATAKAASLPAHGSGLVKDPPCVACNGLDIRQLPFTSFPNAPKVLKRCITVFFSLGVTFNPYEMSIEGVGIIKRILCSLKFLLPHPSAYSVIITSDSPSTTMLSGQVKKATGATMQFLCLDARLGFHHLRKKLRCAILASGTLSPVKAVASELGVEFPHQALCGHVVDTSKQILAASISLSPNGTRLVGTHRHTGSNAYQDALCDTLCALCEAIPRGVLVFFPSYSFMRSCITRWSNTTGLKNLQELKEIYAEPSDPEEFKLLFEDYKKHCGTTKGAALLAVYRGKVSEGLNFSDDMARAVVAIGIPYARLLDPAVVSKREYNTSHQDQGFLSGDE